MAKFWRFDEFVQTTDATPSTMTPPPPPPPRLPSYPPQKSNSRILLVETNSNSSTNSSYTTTSPLPSSISTSSSSSRQRVERVTLQEVSTATTTTTTSPTHYGAASLSYRNSVASTASSQSNLSSKSHPTSFSPPLSPSTIDNDAVLCTSPTAVSPIKPHRPSWTSSMDDSTSAAPYPPFMVGSTLPLGWLRPSLSSTALLDTNQTGHPSHFVCLGFGQTNVLMDLFGLKGPVPLDADGISERSFFFKVDNDQPQRQQAMCTLATLPLDRDESPYLENLTLNRIGVTSILVALPVLSTVDEILRVLGQINKSLTTLDPQGTWWQRLILVFHHETAAATTTTIDTITSGGNTTQNETLDQRFQLVRDTLPTLIQHISVLPCVILMASSTCADYQQQCRRLLYQQLCMHQTDHGWWHGSTAVMDDTSASSDDDELGALLPVAVMIGKKAKKKKKPLFTIDKLPDPAIAPPPLPPPAPAPACSIDGSEQQQQPLPSASPASPSVELKHRFSKKWKEAPKRHHTITKSPPPPPPPCS